MTRVIAMLASIAGLTAGSTLAWRWISRHTNTQVHRINQ